MLLEADTGKLGSCSHKDRNFASLSIFHGFFSIKGVVGNSSFITLIPALKSFELSSSVSFPNNAKPVFLVVEKWFYECVWWLTQVS